MVNEVIIQLSEEPDLDEYDRLARLFGLIAVRAGEVIMKMREGACRPDYKADGSPVTAADVAADEVMRGCLARNLSPLSVVSGEIYTVGVPPCRLPRSGRSARRDQGVHSALIRVHRQHRPDRAWDAG